MKKVVALSIDQMVDKIMKMSIDEGFDFAGGTEEYDLDEATEKDLLYMYGAKAIRVFDQPAVLLGYYGESPLTVISFADEEDVIRSNIKKALEEFDIVDWNRTGCYVVEEVEEQYKLFGVDLTLNKVYTDYLNRLLHEIPQSPDECLLGKEEVISYEAKFENGYSVEIKVCGVEFEEGSTNLPWTEAILFDKNGCEVCVCDAGDELFGTWRLVDPDNNNLYEVKVEESPNKERIVKLGNLRTMSKKADTQYITVKDNSARGASSVPVDQIKAGDYVLIIDQLTRVVPDNVLSNTYPVYEMSDWDEIAKKIAEKNAPEWIKEAAKTAKTAETVKALVDGEIKELPVLFDNHGIDITLDFLKGTVNVVAEYHRQRKNEKDNPFWDFAEYEDYPSTGLIHRLPPSEVEDGIKFNADSNQIEMSQAAFEWFEQYAPKHNYVSELESQLLKHMRSQGALETYKLSDTDGYRWNGAVNLDETVVFKKKELQDFAKKYSIPLVKGEEKKAAGNTDVADAATKRSAGRRVPKAAGDRKSQMPQLRE